MYEWVNSLVNIDLELVELRISLQLNKKELSRWKNFSNANDGDLAKEATFLTSLQKQKKLEGAIDILDQRIEKLEKDRVEIIELIEKFNGLNQRILKMKYVDGLTLESIADELGYSYSYIKSKHAEIMRMINFNKKV